jgi:hypothetical protein
MCCAAICQQNAYMKVENPALIHLRLIAIRETLFSLVWQHQTTIPASRVLLKKITLKETEDPITGDLDVVNRGSP